MKQISVFPKAIILIAVFSSLNASAQIVADFVADKTIGVTPMFVQFTNLSTYPDDPDVQFLWDFGDGELGIGKEPSHLYMTEGVFSVSLAVHVDNVLVATKTREAYITTYTLRPEFSGSPRFALPPFEVDFVNETPPVGPFPIAYLWTFGDGTSSTATAPLHVYTQQGAYDVALRATADGRSVTNTKPGYIQIAAPNPDFTANPQLGVVPLRVQFSNSTETYDFPITFLWEFGDGATSTEVNPVHTYELPGLYDVTLTAMTEFGSLFSLTKPEFIDVVFNANFSAQPTAGAAPLTVDFSSFISIDPDSVEDVRWDFGDGSTSSERDPTYTYDTPGAYDVSLTATTNGVKTTVDKPKYISVIERGPFVRFFHCANPADTFPEITLDMAVYSEAGQNCELNLNNFSVTENGQAQIPQSVSCGEVTFSAVDFVFILDLSGSMGDDILRVRNEVSNFANKAVSAGVSARFGLITYGDLEVFPKLALQLTPEADLLRSALDNVTIWGGIEPGLDAAVFAAQNMAFRSCAQRVLIIVTDEPSNGDHSSLAEAADAVIDNGAVVMAVSPDFLSPPPQGVDPKLLALATAGAWQDIGSADYSFILDRVIEFVLSHWRLTYRTSSPIRDGSLRVVEVSVDDPLFGADTASRTYVAPTTLESLTLRNSFRELDTNADALISLAESGLSSESFSSMDTNGDGFLSLAELLAQTVGPAGVTSPVWVDFHHAGTETGQQSQPFDTLDEGMAFVAPGGEIRLAPGHTLQSYVGNYALQKQARIRIVDGAAAVGGAVP